MYFPPTTHSYWESVSIEELNWNTNQVGDLYDFLANNNTRAFIILKNGRIAIEKYWGNNITNNDEFGLESNWYWASAGKTLTAALVGIAQYDGKLNIDDATSDYLGRGWTSMDSSKENLIKIRHQLTMTTGLDYDIEDLHCTDPDCLKFGIDAGFQWHYHNAPYTLLESVVTNATGKDFNEFTNESIENKIGMNGAWVSTGYNKVYWSTARDMARFGLLILNEGKWMGNSVLMDENYFSEMVSTSQNLNPSYGYLWWLNGKNKIVLPTLSTPLDRQLSNNAPEDLIAGMGKNGQFVDVVPSQKLVVIRMGEAPDGSAVAIEFHDAMWEKIQNLVGSN